MRKLLYRRTAKLSLGLFIACAAFSQTLGLFGPAQGSPFQAGTSPIAIATGDFNGDGKPDLAVANEYTNDFRGGGTITILLNNGSGGFVAAGSPIGVTFSPATIVTGDFNNDGILDLALADNGLTSDAGQLSIFLGNGQGGFTQAPGFPFAVGPGPFSLAVADFNHDGNLDLAIALNRTNQVEVLLGNGQASFISSRFSAGAGPRAVVAGDFNGDGNMDLAVANFSGSNISVLLGDGTGNFTPAPGSPFAVTGSGSNLGPIAMAAGDFNEDGHLDLAIANSAVNNVAILLGDGTGALSAAPASPFPTGSFPTWIAVGDVNGDGHLDLAIANANSNNVTVLAGNGAAAFTSANGSPFAAGAGPQAVVEANFIPGGAPGLAIVNYTGQTISELQNQSCTMSVQPASLALDGATANTSLSVIAANPSACGWSATTNASWITLGTPSGVNSGYETLTIAQNTTGAQRSATILIAGLNVPVTQDATLQEFADVLPGDYYFDAVDLLKQSNVTNGCSTEDYCPTEPVTRAEMAIFIITSIFGPNGGTVPPVPFFSDVPPGSFGFDQIQQLYSLGITNGCGNGDFCPDEVVNREQAAVLIVRARYGSSAQVTYPQTAYFTDVPPNAFGFNFIQRLREDNITSGCSATTFCPTNPVLRGDMAIFLERGMFNNQLPAGQAYIGSLSTKMLSAGSTADITVNGVSTNFVQGVTVVNPIPGVQVNSITVNSPTSLTVNVTAGSMPTNQPEAFWVTTGTQDAVLPAALSVQ
jgi:hypothetical protein